ncbi:MAG: aspartate aminotransferase family protein [Archaeoglobi archaeon]|jgi:acetylornithine/N-succinyldiaminopimelate aminotransferase|nr:MAG: aspartate aminotransferase family protein [Archaeoglobi archaeon]TDA28040.1 MAG: aspartate aminotransferase family protein [Archaeoglobi archaeon]
MDWIEKEKNLIVPVYKRKEVIFERGEGCYLYDIHGKRYLDLVSGIACVAIGHSHPEFVEKVYSQLKKLVQVSNLYYTIPQIILAEKLKKITGMDKFFFCNSGTEAVEASLKFARKATGKKKFVAFTNGFHGRTMGALSVTYKEKFRKPFEPLVQPVEFAKFNDASDLEKKVDENTAAVILELIQGEAGVYPASEEFVKTIFELKEEYGYLVIVDEVQTGFGRTGKWFAKEHYGVEPDIIAMAKAMGSGFPIGCSAVTGEVAEKLEKGDHGSTFGGNPLACAASIATIEIIEKYKLVENSEKMGKYFMERLREMFSEVRGKGLMIGVKVPNAEEIVKKGLEQGVVLNATSEDNLRLVPPLIIRKEDIDLAVEVLAKILR